MTVFFDFSFYHRPMFCFAHDYEDYVARRGLYCDLSKLFEERFIEDSNTLLGAVKRDAENSICDFSINFNKKYMYPSGNAGNKIVERLRQQLVTLENAS